MSGRVITNGHRRDLLYWWELTDAEKAEFDWIDDPDNAGSFFRYRDEVYCLSEFSRSVIDGWDGYRGDSFFSGIVYRHPLVDDDYDDGEVDFDSVVVGLYLS